MTREDLAGYLEPYWLLFDVASIEAMAIRILGALLILLGGFLVSRALQRFITWRMRGSDTGAPEAVQGYRNFVRTLVVVVVVARKCR